MVVSALLVIIVFGGANISYPGHTPVDRLLNGGHGNGTGVGNSTGNTNSSKVPPLVISNKNFTLSGNVSNFINNKSIHGIIIIKNSTMSMELNYSQNGTYKISLPEGNYSMSFSSPAFYNETKSIDLDRNLTENVNLNPKLSIGNGISSLGNETSIEDNNINISRTIPYLTDAGISGYMGVNNITSTSMNNVALQLGKNLSNTTFIVFIKEDGELYCYKGFTNTTGGANMTLYYSGNYSMNAYTLYYNSSTVIYNNANHSKTITFNMHKRETFDETIQLESEQPLNNSASVNKSTLAGQGGIFNITSLKTICNATGTYYNYSVPAGIYSFSYSNKNFVDKNFTIHFTGNGTHIEFIKAYIISVNITGNVNSYTYSISNMGNYTNNGTYRATSGKYQLNVFINGTVIDTKNISLSREYPSYNITVNIFNHRFIMNGTVSTKLTNLYLNFTGSTNTSQLIVGFQLEKFTYNGTLAKLEINSGSYNVSKISIVNNDFNLTNPVIITSGNISLNMVISPYDGYGFSGKPPIQIYVHAYSISVKGNYSEE
jgi:hypothetical protein